MQCVTVKPIAELVEGDLVLAYNEATGKVEVHPITDTISHVDLEIVLLTIDGETLETTAEHPFYEMESAPWLTGGELQGQWTDALELQAGDLVWQADGTTGVVQSVEVVARQQPMYNLTVAEAHTFFVGRGEWLVHNAGPCGNIPLNDEAKDLLRSEARDIWQAQTGRRAIWDNLQVHHRIPLEWAHLFPDADPNRVANLVGVNPNTHQQISNAWTTFRTTLNGATPTAAQVMEQALRIDEQFGNAMHFTR